MRTVMQQCMALMTHLTVKMRVKMTRGRVMSQRKPWRRPC
jgi:hypothetical protein